MPLTRSQIGFKLILCDAAQTDAATGKIHMLGAGWTITGSPTAPHAVALMIQVPWDRTNQKLPVGWSWSPMTASRCTCQDLLDHNHS